MSINEDDIGKDPAAVAGSGELTSQIDGLGSENRDTEEYEGGPYSRSDDPDGSLTDLGRAINGDGDSISSTEYSPDF